MQERGATLGRVLSPDTRGEYPRIVFNEEERSVLVEIARGRSYARTADNLGFTDRKVRRLLENSNRRMGRLGIDDADKLGTILYALATEQIVPEDIIPEGFDSANLQLSQEQQVILQTMARLGTTSRELSAEVLGITTFRSYTRQRGEIVEAFNQILRANGIEEMDNATGNDPAICGSVCWYVALGMQRDPQFLTNILGISYAAFGQEEFRVRARVPIDDGTGQRVRRAQAETDVSQAPLPTGFSLPEGGEIAEAVRLLVQAQGIAIVRGGLPISRGEIVHDPRIIAVGKTRDVLRSFMIEGLDQQGGAITSFLLRLRDSYPDGVIKVDADTGRYVLLDFGRFVSDAEWEILRSLVDEAGQPVAIPESLLPESEE